MLQKAIFISFLEQPENSINERDCCDADCGCYNGLFPHLFSPLKRGWALGLPHGDVCVCGTECRLAARPGTTSGCDLGHQGGEGLVRRKIGLGLAGSQGSIHVATCPFQSLSFRSGNSALETSLRGHRHWGTLASPGREGVSRWPWSIAAACLLRTLSSPRPQPCAGTQRGPLAALHPTRDQGRSRARSAWGPRPPPSSLLH